MVVADSMGHMCLRSPDIAKMDPRAANMALAVWNILMRFNKSLVAAYITALRPDLLKIYKKTYIKTTCFWHELLDRRPCHPARLLDGASLMCMSSSVLHYAIPHS
jgi:hypothetical protein